MIKNQTEEAVTSDEFMSVERSVVESVVKRSVECDGSGTVQSC